MQPLLKNNIYLSTKTGPARTQRAQAILYADHIEILDSKGESILNTPLDKLEKVKSEPHRRMIYFYVQDRFFLIIFPSGRRFIFRILGVIGILLSSIFDHPRNDV